MTPVNKNIIWFRDLVLEHTFIIIKKYPAYCVSIVLSEAGNESIMAYTKSMKAIRKDTKYKEIAPRMIYI